MQQNNDLPNGWISVVLDEITEVIRGSSPRPKGDPHYFGGDIAWIMISDVTREQGKYLTRTRETVTEAGAERSRFLRKGSLILSNSGTVCVPKILAIDGCIHDGFVSFPDVTDETLKNYLYYYFDFIRSKVIQENRQGMTQVNLNTEIVKAFEIRLAPLNEQRRIVEAIEEQFSRLDAGIAALKRLQASMKRYKAAVLKAACEGRLVPQDPNDEPASELLARILQERRAKWEAEQRAKGKDPRKMTYPAPVEPDTEGLPELPEGWVWATVDQLANVVRGASPRPAGDPKYFGGNIAWITVGSLTADESPYLTSVQQFVTEAGMKASRYIEPETLLLTNSGATLGVPKITKIGGCINDGSVALLDVEYPLKLYLYYVLSTMTTRLRAINQGAAQPNLNTSIVKQLHIPLPPLLEQRRIVSEIEAFLSVTNEQKGIIQSCLKRVERLRKSILCKAFSGQLVPQNPNDEPASELLARIRKNRETQQPKKKTRHAHK